MLVSQESPTPLEGGTTRHCCGTAHGVVRLVATSRGRGKRHASLIRNPQRPPVKRQFLRQRGARQISRVLIREVDETVSQVP